MLIARENYACLHISRDHEGYAYDEYMLISAMLIARVNCIGHGDLETPRYGTLGVYIHDLLTSAFDCHRRTRLWERQILPYTRVSFFSFFELIIA